MGKGLWRCTSGGPTCDEVQDVHGRVLLVRRGEHWFTGSSGASLCGLSRVAHYVTMKDGHEVQDVHVRVLLVQRGGAVVAVTGVLTVWD